MIPRAHYIHELGEVQRALLQLGEAVQRALVHAMGALARGDLAAARRIIREDDDIDERRAAVEERALHLIAAQQPFATDLRFLLAALRIADDLERIGDYAEGIAALVLRSADEPTLELPHELNLLTAQVQQMLKLSVAAVVERDSSAIDDLRRADDLADELNRTIRAAMLRRIQSTPHQATRALYFLFVAHNLERIADRAVNIAERTAFIVTGAQPKLGEARDS
ncbi:MAG TPA: phosphate signaling complex protein PhoU [Herpetosiphonaceae bacterium]